MEIKTKFVIGDRVFVGQTRDGHEDIKCPDCLGEKTWAVKSPAGYASRVSCPRCAGYGAIQLRRVEPYVRERIVSGIQLGVGAMEDKRDGTRYSFDDEYKDGCGQCWREMFVHATREEATAAAQLVCDEQNAEIEKRCGHAEVRYLSQYQMQDAENIAANRKIQDLEYELEKLARVINDVQRDNYLLGSDESGGGTISLSEVHKKILRGEACRVSPTLTNYLLELERDDE